MIQQRGWITVNPLSSEAERQLQTDVNKTVDQSFKDGGKVAAASIITATVAVVTVAVSLPVIAESKAAAGAAGAVGSGGTTAILSGATTKILERSLKPTTWSTKPPVKLQPTNAPKPQTGRPGTIQPDKVPAYYRASRTAERLKGKDGFWKSVHRFLNEIQDSLEN